ncbi:MAG: VOC family protein [Acidimicrobiales bacterium]
MPISDVVLDHVAVAVERWQDAWPRYVEQLGGEWSSGGFNVGFAPCQVRFANDARLEILQPHEPAANPFLRRYLDANGAGAHHLTFKVGDIAEALAKAEEAGFSPVAVDLSDPGWKEAFLHPRQASGVVVQLAQAAGLWEAPAPEGFPTVRPPEPAALRHVTHAVGDLTRGRALFEGLLGGEVVSVDGAADGSWRAVTLRWPGPLGVRLVAPGRPSSALTQWLGARSGRVNHLRFDQPGCSTPERDAAVPGVLEDELPVCVVDGDENFGVRLVIGDHARTRRH